MARQVLENGVILPAEYSDDWYDDMTSNLTKLDEVIGSDSEKLSSADVGAAALSNDYTDLDNKPDLTPYDTHLANLDIHVTTSDKATWNTVTSKADDSGVVHNSGNETVSGKKTFTDDITASKNATNGSITLQNASYDPKTNGQSTIDSTKSFSINFVTNASELFGAVSVYGASDRTLIRFTTRYYTDSQNVDYDSVEYTLYGDGTRSFRPRTNNNTTLGESIRKWKEVYGTSYYYGSSNTEFSVKFVTTDTSQTISGTKIFSSTTYICNADDTGNTPNFVFKSSKAIKGDISGTNADSTRISHVDKNNNQLAYIQFRKASNGGNDISLYCSTIDANSQVIDSAVSFYKLVDGSSALRSLRDNEVSLGDNSNKWKDVRTYQINGLTPSSLSLPSGTLTDQIDISSYFTNTGSGDTNSYTASANGWIYLYVTACRTLTAYIQNATDTLYSDYRERSSDGQIRIMLPIQKNNKFKSQWITSSTVSITKAVFIPCQGNI